MPAKNQQKDIDLKNSILKELMFKDKANYSELESITQNHDLFNYHLRELQNKGMIEKDGKSYKLTTTGRQTVALMEEDGQYQKQIKVGLFINLVRKVDSKYQMLLHKRLKHPHFGYIGAVTCKIRWGDSIEDNLIRELKEEINVEPIEFETIGVVREVFRDEKGDKVGDGVYFDIVVTKWSGTPLEKSIEGEYFWYDLDKILDLDKIFRTGFERGLPKLISYLENKTDFSPYILENAKENDKLEF